MKSQGKSTQRTEAAEASKKAILDAAEVLFAEKGYEATSLQEICDLAGVTRGLPNYFFGSKEALYRCVLERTMTRSHDLVTFLREQAQRPSSSAEEILSIAIGRLFDDFVAHPTFIRITEWEALQGRYLGILPLQIQVLCEALQLLQENLGWQGDPKQFLIDLVALCWFPVAHANTFLKPLGIPPHDPDFLARYKQHVIALLLKPPGNHSDQG
ncbi:MAG: TetR/AcrR family transcriptional regulator [Ktedonobacteraceae bacterium]|nr:TetR/AcrR family transcriptional regulator [Ktedonobacteraceae bacterium]